MLKNHSNTMALIEKHIVGETNELSNVEQLLYQDIVTNLRRHPQSEYKFFFNTSIIHFGVPSRTFRSRDYHAQLIEYITDHCNVEREEAIELVCLLNKNVTTNTLKLDVAKVKDGKVVTAIELNREMHYTVPCDIEGRKRFVEGRFCDMIKQHELSKLHDFKTANYCLRYEHGASSDENMRLDSMLYDFTHNL